MLNSLIQASITALEKTPSRLKKVMKMTGRQKFWTSTKKIFLRILKYLSHFWQKLRKMAGRFIKAIWMLQRKDRTCLWKNPLPRMKLCTGIFWKAEYRLLTTPTTTQKILPKKRASLRKIFLLKSRLKLIFRSRKV